MHSPAIWCGNRKKRVLDPWASAKKWILMALCLLPTVFPLQGVQSLAFTRIGVAAVDVFEKSLSVDGRTTATWAVDVSAEKWGWALWDPLWPFFTIFGRMKIHRFVLENTNLSAINIYFSWWMFFPIQAGPTVPDWDPWRDQRSWLFLKWDQWNMGNIEQWNKHKNNHHILTKGTNTLWKSARLAGKSPFGIVYWVSQHLKTCI